MDQLADIRYCRDPWNKGKLVGQKAPFKLKEIWAIWVRLQVAERRRELALFNLAIDSKLRACDLVKLRVRDVCHGQAMASRAIVLQQKTQRPVQFEITEPTREAAGAWIGHARLTSEDSLFPSRVRGSLHLSTRRTCAPCSCCSGTPSWKVRFAISASRLMMRLKWQSKRRCKRVPGRSVPIGR